MPHLARIYINGREYNSEAGSPLAIALYRHGIYSLNRSFKFNRARGLMVFDWWGPERVYVESGFEENPYLLRIYDGLRIKIYSKPTLKSKLIHLFRSLFKVGFYNNWFFRSGIGSKLLIKYLYDYLPYYKPSFEERPPAQYPNPIKIKVDALIIGGGLAGLTTASILSRLGVKVLVIEARDFLGGHLKYIEECRINDTESSKLISELVRSIRDGGGEILYNTVFEGFLDDACIAFKLNTRQLVILEPKAVILATGSRDVPSVYANNDIPCTMLASSVLKLVNIYNLTPGRRGAIIGFTRLGFETAFSLRRRGVEVFIIDKRGLDQVDSRYIDIARDMNIELIDSVDYITCKYGEKVNWIEVYRDGSIVKKGRIDFIVSAAYEIPFIELANQLGLSNIFDYRLGGFTPLHSIDGVTELENVFISGSIGGILPDEVIYQLSKAVGYRAYEYLTNKSLPEDYDESIKNALSILSRDSDLKNAVDKLDRAFKDGFKYSYLNGFNYPTLYIDGFKIDQFICPCMDVTVSDLIDVYNRYGMWRMEHIKRYTGLGTGKCQGRLCLFNAVCILNKITGRDPLDIGLFRSRFPLIPLDLNSAAGVSI